MQIEIKKQNNAELCFKPISSKFVNDFDNIILSISVNFTLEL